MAPSFPGFAPVPPERFHRNQSSKVESAVASCRQVPAAVACRTYCLPYPDAPSGASCSGTADSSHPVHRYYCSTNCSDRDGGRRNSFFHPHHTHRHRDSCSGDPYCCCCIDCPVRTDCSLPSCRPLCSSHHHPRCVDSDCSTERYYRCFDGSYLRHHQLRPIRTARSRPRGRPKFSSSLSRQESECNVVFRGADFRRNLFTVANQNRPNNTHVYFFAPFPNELHYFSQFSQAVRGNFHQTYFSSVCLHCTVRFLSRSLSFSREISSRRRKGDSCQALMVMRGDMLRSTLADFSLVRDVKK